MAKKNLKKPVCDACGVDVREGSLYCYNCGGAVAPESKQAGASPAKTAVSDAWFKDDIAVKNDRQTNKLEAPKTEVVLPLVEEPRSDSPKLDAPIPKPGIYEEARLKSAASMRRKGKSIERKTVEVVWEKPESTPDARFILAALLMSLMVILIFFAAAYLK